MDYKLTQIKYMQQQYYKKIYKKTKAINDINYKISNKNINVKIIHNIIHRHNEYLKHNNIQTDLTPMQLIGCNYKTFVEYLNSKLDDNMNLLNYGEWEIDHIYPISKIDSTNIEDIKKYFHYTNLQPLNKIDNIKKSNNI
jgi:hypothetical protein